MKTEFKCEELEKVVQICKENNIECYAFQKDRPISQIFVVDTNGRIGTVSENFGGLTYATVHKPCFDYGTGFGLSGYNRCEKASIKRVKDAMYTTLPDWAMRGTVKKYKDWADYVSTPINRTLEYYKL